MLCHDFLQNISIICCLHSNIPFVAQYAIYELPHKICGNMRKHISSRPRLHDDSTPDQFRDSVADVRKKRKAPSTSVPFNLLQDHEFDRRILQILDSFLRHTNIPVTLLKSNYFTSRSQLLHLYDEDRLRVRSWVEAAADALKMQTMNDYTTLVNETNRIYMSRYPFAAIAGAMGIDKHVDGFLRSERKIHELATLVLAVPESQLKVQDLNDITSTYGRTTEAKLIHPEHFMIRAQKVMVDDASFIQEVLKDKSKNGLSSQQCRYQRKIEWCRRVRGLYELRPLATLEQWRLLYRQHRQRSTGVRCNGRRTSLVDRVSRAKRDPGFRQFRTQSIHYGARLH